MLVTNIQRFSLHDGPGIRTTVFLKGCSLRCPWCSNPENLNPFPEEYYKDGEKGVFGKYLSEDEIYNEVMKDINFYAEDGGVTFSGGEALLQSTELIPLLKRFKNKGITTAVETCLFVPTKNLQEVMDFIDYFYVDMKILDNNKCMEIIKGDLDLYENNLAYLCDKKKIVIRIPYIGGYTNDLENKKLIISEINKFKNSIFKVEIIKGHNLSKSKYESLNLPVPTYIAINDLDLDIFKQEIETATRVSTDLCKI